MNSPPSPFIWSTSICEETMPDPRPTEFRVSCANCSSWARFAFLAAICAAILGSGPRSSMASSSSGTSDCVIGAPLGRVSAAMPSSSSHGASARRRSGWDHRLSISHVPFIGSHARFSATLTLSFRRRFVSASFSSSSDGV